MLRAHRGKYSFFLDHVPASWFMSFPSPAHQSKHRAICGNQCKTDTGSLMFIPNLTPLHCGKIALLSQTCLSPSVVGLSPRRPAQAPARTMSPNQRVLQGLSSGAGGVRSDFISRPEHTQLKLTTFWPRTKYCPQQWPEGAHKSRAYIAHTRDIP